MPYATLTPREVEVCATGFAPPSRARRTPFFLQPTTASRPTRQRARRVAPVRTRRSALRTEPARRRCVFRSVQLSVCPVPPRRAPRRARLPGTPPQPPFWRSAAGCALPGHRGAPGQPSRLEPAASGQNGRQAPSPVAEHTQGHVSAALHQERPSRSVCRRWAAGKCFACNLERCPQAVRFFRGLAVTCCGTGDGWLSGGRGG